MQRTDLFDLGTLSLASGEGRRLELLVGVEPLQYGGERYTPSGGSVTAILDAARTTAGYSLRLRYEAQLDGPCMRCLGAAAQVVSVDAREIDQPGGGDELRSPYLDGEQLDLHAWARDALALALPAKIVCREDCLGLCPACGADLNEAGPEHRHERAPDPRWAALREIRFE